jgi:hypothetical protein
VADTAAQGSTEALRELREEEIVLDGEAMAHCKDGLPDFHGLRSEEGGAAPCLLGFDLFRLNGEDLRPLPLEERRARLREVLRGAGKALRFSEHLEGDGEAIFRHACALGLEGIVSKRRTPATVGPKPLVAQDQEPELRLIFGTHVVVERPFPARPSAWAVLPFRTGRQPKRDGNRC